MPYLDRREPGVYVDIEDRSYVAPVIENGRIVYSVILCDRGPSDQIVKITSQKQFHTIFGTPNFLKTSQTHYQIDNALSLTGNVLVTRVVPDDSYISNIAVKENSVGEIVNSIFLFTNGLKEVTMTVNDSIPEGTALYGVSASGTAELEKIQIGSWIYAEHDSPAVAAQVVNRVVDSATGEIKLTLDKEYAGISAVGPAYKYVPYELSSLADVTSSDLLVNADGDVVYYFYAHGAGKYYNRLAIRGTRNTDLEKMFLNTETGEPLYKYMFLDVGVYEQQPNGNYKLLEGPWTVSTIPRYPDNQNQLIQNPITGAYLFIEDVINSESNFIRCIASTRDPVTDEPNAEFPAINRLITSADSESKRLQVMLMFSTYSPIGTENIAQSRDGVRLENGTDGTGLYNTAGNIQASETLLGKVANAFNGKLTKNGIDQIRESLYPTLQPDYIVCGGYPAEIQASANELTAMRADCMCLGDTGAYYTSYDKDKKARKDKVSWNNAHSMLYVQYRRIFDTYTGRNFWVSPVYHAIARHLFCDAMYFIAEPVAGITKGAIEEPIVLAYTANHTERGDLGEVDLNVTIDEPQGKYFLTQYTTWKAFSALKRGHVAKFTEYLKKTVPVLLKDLLQRKGTPFWIQQANLRLNTLLNKFLNGPVERYSVLNSYTTVVTWDETASAIDVTITIQPIRAIERINVTIAVI